MMKSTKKKSSSGIAESDLWTEEEMKIMTGEKKSKKESHFEDLEPWDAKVCRHSEHKPPGHIVIPQGKVYVHICPGCGRETRVYPQQYSLKGG